MPTQIVENLDWLSSNAGRAYPLTVEATAKDLTGSFTIPDDFLVELYLSVNAGLAVDPSLFYISAIGAYSNGYSVVIGYAGENVATALIAGIGFKRNTPYRLGGIGNFVDATGHLVIGSLDNINIQPQGQWSFDEAGGQLEMDCIRPIIQGVSALQVQNGGDLSPRIYGDTILVAGSNFRITPVLIEGQDPQLVFDAIDGDGLNSSCDTVTAPPINFINSVGPNAAGNFNLLGDDCLVWQSIINGLQALDKCSQPCCGCTELETIVAAEQRLSQEITTTGNFVTQLQTVMAELENRINASVLGNASCTDCP